MGGAGQQQLVEPVQTSARAQQVGKDGVNDAGRGALAGVSERADEQDVCVMGWVRDLGVQDFVCVRL